MTMTHVTRVSDTAVNITGCIISYPHLFEARRANERSDPKYSANFILPATMGADDWELLNNIINSVAAKKWPNGAPENLRMPWKDAAKTDPRSTNQLMVTASADPTKTRPQVVREDPKLLAEPGEVYPGMGVSAYLNIFAYDAAGNRGVSFGLIAVQITDRTLPTLDGRKNAAEVFSAVSVAGGPAPVSPAPVAPGMPPAAAPAPAPVAPPAAPPAAGPSVGPPQSWTQ